MMKKIMSLILGFAFASNLLMAQQKPTGLKVNDSAPNFSNVNQYGKTITLQNELKKGAVVVIFYRGEWCGFCNKQLKDLEDSLSFITNKGATVIAITPEKKENVLKTIEKTKATFSIITDDDIKIMQAYKVNFELDEKTTAKYKGYGIVLADKNKGGVNSLPVPAVYIINKEGKITFTYFDENYSKRLSVKHILDNL